MSTRNCTGWADTLRRSLVCGLFAAATVRGAEVNVSIVETAGFSPRSMERARATLGDVFNHAGLEIRWRGTPTNGSYQRVASGRDPEFPEETGPGNDEQHRCGARGIRVRILAHPPRGSRLGIVGYSLRLPVHGINITIFESTVRDTATLHGLDPGQVLGHAIAHEIGHVLLRSAPHDAHGLMAAAWGASEFDLMHRATLRFRSRQMEVMKNTVAAEGCHE